MGFSDIIWWDAWHIVLFRQQWEVLYWINIASWRKNSCSTTQVRRLLSRSLLVLRKILAVIIVLNRLETCGAGVCISSSGTFRLIIWNRDGVSFCLNCCRTWLAFRRITSDGKIWKNVEGFLMSRTGIIINLHSSFTPCTGTVEDDLEVSRIVWEESSASIRRLDSGYVVVVVGYGRLSNGRSVVHKWFWKERSWSLSVFLS